MVPWTAAAALLLCGLASSAPSAAGARADPPPTDAASADASAELRVGAAELAAVPAESRAVLAKVLGRLEGLRSDACWTGLSE
jgi:hypothetical protein